MYLVVIYEVCLSDISLFYLVGVETDFDPRFFALLFTENLFDANEKALDKYNEYLEMGQRVAIDVRKIQTDSETIPPPL